METILNALKVLYDSLKKTIQTAHDDTVAKVAAIEKRINNKANRSELANKADRSELNNYATTWWVRDWVPRQITAALGALSDALTKRNPRGTGSLAMNQTDESKIGENALISGDRNSAQGSNSVVSGREAQAAGYASTVHGIGTIGYSPASLVGGYYNLSGYEEELVAEWDASVWYHAGDIVKIDGVIYVCTDYDNGRHNPSTDPSGYWIPLSKIGTDVSTHDGITGRYLHIIGNGIRDDKRSNAYVLDTNGNGWYSGNLYVGSTSGKFRDSGSKKVATIPDWNQNDSTATDYIQNRPFGFRGLSTIIAKEDLVKFNEPYGSSESFTSTHDPNGEFVNVRYAFADSSLPVSVVESQPVHLNGKRYVFRKESDSSRDYITEVIDGIFFRFARYYYNNESRLYCYAYKDAPVPVQITTDAVLGGIDYIDPVFLPDGIATEEYVTNAIANADIGGGGGGTVDVDVLTNDEIDEILAS